MKHHRIIVRRIYHFVSQMLLDAGPLLQCILCTGCIESAYFSQGILDLQPFPMLPAVPPHGGSGQAHPQATLQIQEVPHCS
jgi:hypothetical protein